MGMSDAQYKDILRRDLEKTNEIIELVEADKKEEALKKLKKEVERINASLQD